MELLYSFNHPALILLLMTLFAATLLQTTHVVTLFEQAKSAQRDRTLRIYELVVALHIFLSLLLTHAAYAQIADFYVRILGAGISLIPLLYLNVAACVFAVCAAIRYRLWWLLGDALCMAFMVPALFAQVAFPILVYLYAAWLLARTLYVTHMDWRAAHEQLGRQSINDAMVNLPEGIMLAKTSGRVVLLNSTMRTLLLSLEKPLRLSDAHMLWTLLQAIGETQMDGSVLVQTADHHALLFYKSETQFSSGSYELYWAFDVTEEITLSKELEQANEQLALTAEKLQIQLQNVETIAEHEALLSMRARVHDVTSQRLSILHSMLQAGKIDDESLAELKPLLTSVLADLSSASEQAAPLDIASLQQAFSLIGVDIRVSGVLPADKSTQYVFAQLVREAATNAVRHAQASVLDVHVIDAPGFATITLTNNGKAPDRIVEGRGMKGMRRRVEQKGGIFEIRSLEPLTLYARIPLEKETV